MRPVLKDHKEQGLSRLLEQFKDKPNITALLEGWLQGVQTTEDSLFDLLDNRSIQTAYGVQLDYIGKIVGAKRGGRSDSSYREFIQLQILINTSEGTPTDILEILSLITNADIVKSFPHYPVGGNLYTDGDNIPSTLASTLTKAAPISHGEIHVYHDPNKNAFIPATLTRQTGILVDNNGDEVVDNNGNNIIVGGLGAATSENSWRGVPSTVGGEVTQYGIPCHVYTK